jgi:uncharacterized protein YceK
VRHWLTASVTLLLAGCGSVVDFLSGERVEGDSESVTVKADSAPRAAPLALAIAIITTAELNLIEKLRQERIVTDASPAIESCRYSGP